MLAVIFEVIAKKGKEDNYLDAAKALMSDLEGSPGFISIERFQSLKNSRKILSLSFWEDEESITKWRNHNKHRITQQAGRNTIFETYRLRVALVERDYGMNERDAAPRDSITYHTTSL